MSPAEGIGNGDRPQNRSEMDESHCPCCKQTWPGPDRIAFLGQTVATDRGYTWFKPKTVKILKLIHETRGGLSIPAMLNFWRSQEALEAWVDRTNKRLKKIGWRLLQITHKDGSDGYGLCEILRTEAGRLNCIPRSPS